jgi:putative glutamine amidotransferase
VGGKPGIEVSSSHHQAVKKLGQGLRVSARAPDGVVEGVEMPGRQSFWGVQWHPEKDPGSEPTRLLFAALVQMARLEGRAPMGGK